MSDTKTTEPVLKQHTCATCGDVRDVFSFYDGKHRVWMLEDMTLHIDHGEADPYQ